MDKDVLRMLRDAMHRSRRSFKVTLNAAVRAGLTGQSSGQNRKPFVVQARPLGLHAGFDPAGFNKLADDLEAEHFAAQPKRARRA